MQVWAEGSKKLFEIVILATSGPGSSCCWAENLLKYALKCNKNIKFDIQYPVWSSGMGFSDFLYIGVCMHSHIQTSKALFLGRVIRVRNTWFNPYVMVVLRTRRCSF